MANSTKDSRSSRSSRSSVSLEELLRFKRAERPDEAFWEQFDGELHERMMQTLVKKAPWHVQILRGLSGKFAESTAIAAAAAVLALMVVRPALIAPADLGEQNQPTLASTSTPHMSLEATEGAEAAANEIDPSLMAEADYRIEALSASAAGGDSAVTRDFGLDHLDAARYDRTAYSADMALSGVTSSGVASIVY